VASRRGALPRFKKEQRARCRVFGEWLAEFKKDAADSKHRAFFAYLKGDYEDFGAYRRIAETGGQGGARAPRGTASDARSP